MAEVASRMAYQAEAAASDAVVDQVAEERVRETAIVVVVAAADVAS
jgi:hypothetical protein